MTMRTGGQILVASLLAQRATHAFGVPGESYLAVLDALHDVADRLRFVICRQEGGAAYMAEAFGKLTGRPGIVFVTRGPGASNAAVGIHTAKQDSTPMIVFVGQVGTDMSDRDAFQEIDYRQMYGSVAKWAAQIDRAERIPEYVAHAYRVAMSGRPGPVVLALPEDMLTTRAEVGDAPYVEPIAAAPSRDDVADVEARLRAAQRPLVIVGGSRWDQDARDALERFADCVAIADRLRVSPPGHFRQPASGLRRRRGDRHQSEARRASARRRRPARHRRAARRNDDVGIHAARCPGAEADADSRPSGRGRAGSRLPAGACDRRDTGCVSCARSTVPLAVRAPLAAAPRARTPNTKHGVRRVRCPAPSTSGASCNGSTSACRATRS